MSKQITCALLALFCSGVFAQIFGPPDILNNPPAAAQPVAPVVSDAPAGPDTKKLGPPPATDFRSVAMACANTGQESTEAFDACMKSSLISHPGVPKAMLEAIQVPSPKPYYAQPVAPSALNSPLNLFASPR